MVSVVIPCLDEAETIGRVVDAARASFDAAGVTGEVIVADNGSTDGSQELAAAHGARVVRESVKGYGSALRRGCDEATGTYIVMGDADESYDFSQIGPFVDELRAGADLVMGTRTRGTIMPGAMPWKNRYIGNPLSTGPAESPLSRRRVRRPLRDARVHEGRVSIDGSAHDRAWSSRRRW